MSLLAMNANSRNLTNWILFGRMKQHFTLPEILENLVWYCARYFKGIQKYAWVAFSRTLKILRE